MIIYGRSGQRRFTQDSPIYADVWFECLEQCLAGRPYERIDLLLIPHRASTTAKLHEWIFRRLNAARERNRRAETPKTELAVPFGLAYSESQVAVRLSLGEMLRVALPLTSWWRKHVWKGETRRANDDEFKRLGAYLDSLRDQESAQTHVSRENDWSDDLVWMINLVGWLSLIEPVRSSPARQAGRRGASDYELVRRCWELLDGYRDLPAPDDVVLWSIYSNRQAGPSLNKSVPTIKAVAAKHLFHVNCSRLNWAVIDSGVDATHPAFRLRGGPPPDDRNATPLGHTRVRATYDFTRLRTLLSQATDAVLHANSRPRSQRSSRKLRVDPVQLEHERDFIERLAGGGTLNWDTLAPQLRVPHRPTPADKQSAGNYEIPQHPHGTHVAGILAGDWPEAGLVGVCPDLRLYDLRVFDSRGTGDEYSVSAALQFVRYLNSRSDRLTIHGVNLSLSILHEADKFACGQTPVCRECDRLVAMGVAVVAAAGNCGYSQFVVLGPEGETSVASGYLGSGISDPGNAERVITVGATYREHPHVYGVSYFSSRGPTGDGRSKPDLLAPGEKITAPVPGGRSDTFDGTSMAAPHVSGAAALLMARHTELIGNPLRVKQILCESATDLGRERYFQGAGLVDVLRALQSV